MDLRLLRRVGREIQAVGSLGLRAHLPVGQVLDLRCQDHDSS